MKRFSFLLAFCIGIALQSADAAPYKLIHAFVGGNKDGRTPTLQSSLTVSGSVFYGMTLDGGKYTNGVVFKINTDGTGEQLLHTFDGWSILNMKGSKEDGAYPVGTPVLSGSTLYGVTGQGGNNGGGLEWGLGTVFSVDTDGNNFQVLHNFGAFGDGSAPVGTLVLQGSTLYGMTESGGSNIQGTIFSIQTDGSGYQSLYSFEGTLGNPQGSLALAAANDGPSTLYGMTPGAIFRINTDGTGFLVIHNFAGTANDGASAMGSVTISMPYVYGMTLQGGQNGIGTVFKFDLLGSSMQILHSFSLSDAWGPWGDLALSGGTLYGMTFNGVTNYYHSKSIPAVGSGAVIQINTDGTDYQVIHTFLYPAIPDDGSLPYGTPVVVGSELYGMTSLGGAPARLPLGTTDGGCIFALTLSGNSGSGGSSAPTITTTSPLPTGYLDVAYKQQLAASGGETPYTWAVSAGHLPKGLTLSPGGLLSGKPTAGETIGFTIKVTGHDKLSSSQAFMLTVEAPPKITITVPKSNEKVTTPTLDVSGTASGAVSLNGVYFQLNGGLWTVAQSSDGFAKWNVPNLALMADTNIFSAYSVDSSGLFSETNTVKFIYYVTTPLTVTTTGSGSFTPPDNGKKLQVGATFPITAKPAKGFVFTDWTDGLGAILTTSETLKFVMTSNLTLIANFTAAPK